VKGAPGGRNPRTAALRRQPVPPRPGPAPRTEPPPPPGRQPAGRRDSPGRFFTPPEAIAGRSCPCGECACAGIPPTVGYYVEWRSNPLRGNHFNGMRRPVPDRSGARNRLEFPYWPHTAPRPQLSGWADLKKRPHARKIRTGQRGLSEGRRGSGRQGTGTLLSFCRKSYRGTSVPSLKARGCSTSARVHRVVPSRSSIKRNAEGYLEVVLHAHSRLRAASRQRLDQYVVGAGTAPRKSCPSPYTTTTSVSAWPTRAARIEVDKSTSSHRPRERCAHRRSPVPSPTGSRDPTQVLLCTRT